LVGRAGAAECGKNIEGPGIELMALEGGTPGSIKMASQSSHAREDLERRHIEIGAFSAPCRDNPVDLVVLAPVLAHPLNLLKGRQLLVGVDVGAAAQMGHN